MKNLVQEGVIIRATSPYDRTAGQGAKIAHIFGVAAADVLSGILGEFQIEGVFDITKAVGAWTEGALIYWDDTAKNATTTSTSNTLIGVAILGAGDVMAASGDATGRVRLNKSFS